VPKLYVHFKGRDEQQYFRRMGYREKQEPGVGGSQQTRAEFEATDQYADRLQGYLLFFGAFVQCDQQSHPYGLPQGWQYIARCSQLQIAARLNPQLQACVVTSDGQTHTRCTKCLCSSFACVGLQLCAHRIVSMPTLQIAVL
jgi:hypothetical protein